jgi:hypothetical protein
MALQETYLINDLSFKWSGNYAFTKAESPHSAGCVTYFNSTVRILEQRDIDDKGHGHVVVIDGINDGLYIVGNIYSPVKSLIAEQESFYKKLGEIIEELEIKYINNEPGLILLGDFNIP